MEHREKYISTIHLTLLIIDNVIWLAHSQETKCPPNNNLGPTTDIDVFNLHMPENYSRFQIPSEAPNKPINVKIQFNIVKILDFDEDNEEVKLDLEFRVFWTDFKILNHFNEQLAKSNDSCAVPRSIDDLSPDEIRRKRKTLNNPKLLESLWKPNLFIGNLLKVKQPTLMSQLVTLKVIPEVGWFEYLTRIIVTLNCEMEFNFYPADTQNCYFSIRGFSYTDDKLKLGWYKTGVWLYDLKLPNFDVMISNLRESVLVEDDEADTNSDEAAGQFHVLSFNLKARRNLSYHLVQTYLSSTFYIIITCLCFLVPSRFVEARVGICMTTLLTLTSMFAAVRESTPIVSYVKAIDVWMIGCIFFVFLTLAEFTIHMWLQSLKEEAKIANESEEKLIPAKLQAFHEKNEIQQQNKPPTYSTESVGSESLKLNSRKLSVYSNESIKIIQKFEKVEVYEKLVSLIENFSFPVFISLFGIFTVMYWVWLLNSSDYFTWDIDPKYNNIDGMTE